MIKIPSRLPSAGSAEFDCCAFESVEDGMSFSRRTGLDVAVTPGHTVGYTSQEELLRNSLEPWLIHRLPNLHLVFFLRPNCTIEFRAMWITLSWIFVMLYHTTGRLGRPTCLRSLDTSYNTRRSIRKTTRLAPYRPSLLAPFPRFCTIRSTSPNSNASCAVIK
jgi:hypothetical protein